MNVTRSILHQCLAHHRPLSRMAGILLLYQQSEPGTFQIDPDVLSPLEFQHLGIVASLTPWNPYDLHALFEIIQHQSASEEDYYFGLKLSYLMEFAEEDRIKLLHQYFTRRPRTPLEHIFVLLNAVVEEDKKVLAMISQAIFKSTYTPEDYRFLQMVWLIEAIPRSNTIVSGYRHLFRLLIESDQFNAVAEQSPHLWEMYSELFSKNELLKLAKHLS